jgi:hypothetical protein
VCRPVVPAASRNAVSIKSRWLIEIRTQVDLLIELINDVPCSSCIKRNVQMTT